MTLCIIFTFKRSGYEYVKNINSSRKLRFIHAGPREFLYTDKQQQKPRGGGG